MVLRSSFPSFSGSALVLVLASSVGVSKAQSPVVPEKPVVQQLHKYLIRQLKLQSWNISLVLSKREDLRGGTLDNIHWDPTAKAARIHVLNASEYPVPFESALKDMEFTGIHELIHLSRTAFPRNDTSRPEEEATVNLMAGALLQNINGEE